MCYGVVLHAHRQPTCLFAIKGRNFHCKHHVCWKFGWWEEMEVFEVCCHILVFELGQPITTLLWPSVGVKPNTWKKWGFGVLWDSRMFRARQQGSKHLALGVFLVSLQRSWSVDIENGLALAIWTSVAQVMGKRRAGSQTGSLTPDH